MPRTKPAAEAGTHFVVERLNWRRGHGDTFYRYPGQTRVASFATAAEAEAFRRVEEAKARNAVNPFAGTLAPPTDQTSMPEAVLCDWLQDHGIDPPTPDKKSGKRLMGFGHRVYKNYDPRAKIIKRRCDELLGQLKRSDPLLDIAKHLEETALHDSYFVERKLYPNVDFYSGIIMRAIGIPLEMFTVMFAIGRMPGWIANYREVLDDASGRIYRPRQIYTGQPLRHYVPLEERD